LEELWSKIDDARRIATAGGAPLHDVTVITLTLAMFEKSGLLSHTTQMFRLRPIGVQVSGPWTSSSLNFNLAIKNAFGN